MDRLRGIWISVINHRLFMPALIASAVMLVVLLFSFEHSRNIVKVRGPYTAVLIAIVMFPVFAFRFFDPHEDARPISAYFVVVSAYYILLGAPDLVLFLRHILFDRMPLGAVKQLSFGLAAFIGLAGGLHYALKIWWPSEETDRKFLAIPPGKFMVYAILHIIYPTNTKHTQHKKFGISSALS